MWDEALRSTTRAVRALLLASFSSACAALSACAAARAPEPPPRAVVSPPPPAASPRFAVHEWGLIDADASGGSGEVSAGPGRVGFVAPDPGPRPTRKPVLYVHLEPGTPAVRLRVAVALMNGQVIEHFPRGSLVEHGVVWPEVLVRAGACASRDAPVRRELAGECASVDGYCEIDELPRYVTSDADCLSVGGVESSLLFYRGDASVASLPLRIDRDLEQSVRVTATGPTRGASPFVLRVTNAPSPTTPGLRVAQVEMPQEGEHQTLPLPSIPADPSGLRRLLASELERRGLGADERRAFLDAWADELFVAPRIEDVLLYFAPESALGGIAGLVITPPPTALRRAMLIRVDLGAPR